uniref:Saposin B-type domain-containing protein n=1 Tax=Panagrolaimus superbus TaxID=310955 RepID=A0A914Y856_9BILA
MKNMTRFYSYLIAFGFVATVASMPFDVFPNFDPCQTCNFIVGRAEHHFKPNETATQLQSRLDFECQQLGHFQGQNASDHCKKIIDSHIQTIYSDIKAGKRPHQICFDIGECASPSGAPPSRMPPSGAPKAEILARPHDPCRTCEFIIGRAEYHIHNGNVTDEKRLLRELEHECIQLAHVEGDQASVDCLNLIQKDIDMIFNDIKAGKRPRQICEDMRQCHATSGRPSSGPIFASTPSF